MQSRVEISVVMSVYNSDQWLKESISSILNQTFKNFEFIIINDGSTDKSESIIKSFADQDERIRFFNQSNYGLTRSLNKAVSVSIGKYIARIDADDISLPDRLKKQYEILESSENIGLCYTNFYEIDFLGKKIRKKMITNRFNLIKHNLSRGVNNIAHSSVMFRKSVFDKLSGYREKLKKSQDFDLWLRMSEITTFSSTEGEPCVHIRIHKDSITFNEFDIYLYISLLSFFARKNLLNDPLNYPAKDFNVFYKWVNEYLISRKEDKKTQKRQQINLLLSLKKFRSNDLIRLLISVVFSKYSYVVIFEKIFGYSIHSQFYRDWRLKFNYS